MSVTVLYFAWLRQKIGVGEDTVEVADGTTVGALIETLKSRSPAHAEALANPDIVRIAVNQDYVQADAVVKDGDEVALFPPVTGG